MTDSPNTPPADLLDFTPVVRKVKRPDGWTPELQREFIRRVSSSSRRFPTAASSGLSISMLATLFPPDDIPATLTPRRTVEVTHPPS